MSDREPHFLPTIPCVSPNKRNGLNSFFHLLCYQKSQKSLHFEPELEVETDLHSQLEGCNGADHIISSSCADPTIGMLAKDM
jgi:hypothetical protein